MTERAKTLLELADEATAAIYAQIDEIQPELQRRADEATEDMIKNMGQGATL